MKKYTIWSYGNLFTCTQTPTGITITNNKENSGLPEDEMVGEMVGITLPAEDEHEDTIVGFEMEVFNWLEENYW
jgi:hypothetical protein